MHTAQKSREYHKKIKKALGNDFQRRALDRFVRSYRESRQQAFAGYDLAGLVREIAESRDASIAAMDELYAEFERNAKKAGARVHLAGNAREANEIILEIARENSCSRVVKSKSMTAEEIMLNPFLEEHGLTVTETDLGEWIIQLRGEGPTHMVMPAIHLSREQVGELFSRVTGEPVGSDILELVRVARKELRQRFIRADMGISGANFALADSGTIGIVTNEGNGRLVTTLPRVHVVLLGLDKLVFGLHDALRNLKGLTRNATAQAITSYVSWITGAGPCASSPDGRKEMHIVFLDNGRRALARDSKFSQVLRCLRCGACANVYPIFKMIGGREYGHIYIGAIGLILTYFFHGRDKDEGLIQNCLNCQACREVCIAGIDLPRLIKEVQALIRDQERPTVLDAVASRLLTNRKFMHGLLRAARHVQYPISGGKPFLRHLPEFFLRDHGFKALPALAKKPFRDRWPKIKTEITAPKYRVALFTGCLQDFVYPEQLEAALRVLSSSRVRVDFPAAQGCCGLPAYMLGNKQAAREAALHNLSSFDPANYDFILTLCASCASHLKNSYPRLVEEGRGARFAGKVIDFASFVFNYCTRTKPGGVRRKFAYHAPCHLCRGLGVRQGSREVLQAAGLSYVPVPEEETCCGFGGVYSLKFPEISAAILRRKLDLVQRSKAKVLVTDCPGCILQLRGGARKSGYGFEVAHTAEVLAGSGE
ncbi:MAG: L-lactate dehydrogenase (quinone) large subunit LdhH [Desulfonatronovibrionaceae bacterium]